MDLRSLLIGFAFALVWSSAFTSAHVIVASAPPITALDLRFLCSGLIGVALARAMGEDWRLTRGQVRNTVVFGICQNALYLGLYFTAMQTVPAGIAAIVAATMPLVVAGLGRLFRADRLPPLGLAGLVLGFAGVALILGRRLSVGTDLHGLALCVLGTLALALATLSLRGASSGGNVMTVVGLQMLVGAVVLAPLGILQAHAVTVTPTLALAFGYTLIGPGLLATWLWFVLVARIGPARAATYHFLNPIFGVGIAALFLGERFGPVDMLGVAITTVGILAVQLSRRPEAGLPPAPADAKVT